MDAELRKRLEEAAEKYIERNYKDSITPDWNERDFLAGAEQGYKEAIKEAIKWWSYNLLDNYHNAEAYVEKRITKEELLKFFETDMNKLFKED